MPHLACGGGEREQQAATMWVDQPATLGRAWAACRQGGLTGQGEERRAAKGFYGKRAGDPRRTCGGPTGLPAAVSRRPQAGHSSGARDCPRRHTCTSSRSV